MGDQDSGGGPGVPEGTDAARDLIRGATKILEPRMRLVYFAQRVRDYPDAVSIEVLRELFAAAGERHPGALALLHDLGREDALAEILGPEKVSRVYHGARGPAPYSRDAARRRH